MENISKNKKQLDHFFFDGYSIEEKELSNLEKISLLLKNINQHIFHNKGKTVLIPYFHGKVKTDGGISGIILGEGCHFTCHTFCYKNTVFIDYFGDKCENKNVQKFILDTFSTKDYDLCNHNQNLQGNFGKHIIIYSTSVFDFQESEKMIAKILGEIDMTPIHEMIINQTDEKHFDILQPIAESHISVHRIDNKMILDVFSCKYFDEKKLVELLNITDFDQVHEINRGIKFQ